MNNKNGTDNQCAQIHITGRVQGVGFRYWTASLARSMGVRGTIQNLPDGALELFAEAAPEILERFIARVIQGPPGADVADAQIKTGDFHRPFHSFTILR